jgi:uncharacterized protein YbjT (DUF2867 family)
VVISCPDRAASGAYNKLERKVGDFATVLLVEAGLDRGEVGALRQAFDGGDVPALDLDREHDARLDVIGGELIDKARQEEVLRNSDADWTIVRPSRLTGEPARQRMAVAERLRYSPRASISRADVARFMVDGVGDQRLFRRTVEISDHARAEAASGSVTT